MANENQVNYANPNPNIVGHESGLDPHGQPYTINPQSERITPAGQGVWPMPFTVAQRQNDAFSSNDGVYPDGTNIIPVDERFNPSFDPHGQALQGIPAGVRKNIILSAYELGRLDEREERLKKTKRDEKEATPKYQAIEAEKQINREKFDKMMEEIRRQWSEEQKETGGGPAEQNGGRRKSSKRKGRGIRGKILTKRRIKRRRCRLTRRGYIAKYPSRN